MGSEDRREQALNVAAAMTLIGAVLLPVSIGMIAGFWYGAAVLACELLWIGWRT